MITAEQGRYDGAGAPGAGAPYARLMMGRLQDRTGAPNRRTRVLAGCVILGMVVLTAPLVVLPVVHWLARFL